MHYNEFNKILNSIFFDGRFKQIPVFLDLEDDVKEELSKKVDLLKSDFDHQLGQVQNPEREIADLLSSVCHGDA